MKKLSKILALVLVLMMVLATVTVFNFTASAADRWVKTDLANIQSTDVVVIAWKNSSGETYALTNGGGSSSAPKATKLTVNGDTLSGTISDNLKWNISNSSGKLTIYPNGKTTEWLYCTSNNNGVRVGTNANKTFTIDSTSGYLKHTGTSRYLGVYNKSDVRCYTNTTGNTANQTLVFYVLTADSHTHAHTSSVTKEPTCTNEGVKTLECACGDKYTETIKALGHDYVEGICSRCFAEDPTYGKLVESATLAFTSANRTTYDKAKQSIWEANGVKFINGKGNYSNDLGDYNAPLLLYK